MDCLKPIQQRRSKLLQLTSETPSFHRLGEIETLHRNIWAVGGTSTFCEVQVVPGLVYVFQTPFGPRIKRAGKEVRISDELRADCAGVQLVEI